MTFYRIFKNLYSSIINMKYLQKCLINFIVKILLQTSYNNYKNYKLPINNMKYLQKKKFNLILTIIRVYV